MSDPTAASTLVALSRLPCSVSQRMDLLYKTEWSEDLDWEMVAALAEYVDAYSAPRSATAVATVDGKVLTLAQHDFDVIANEHPRLGEILLRKLAALMSHRLRQTSGALAEYLEVEDTGKSQT